MLDMDPHGAGPSLMGQDEHRSSLLWDAHLEGEICTCSIYVVESICSFSHWVFSGSLPEFKKRFSLYFSLNFLINLCIHSSIYAKLLIFGNSFFFFFYTRIIMLIFSLNLIGVVCWNSSKTRQ